MGEGGWYGVDLDGTLAVYDPETWEGLAHIGAPVPAMVARVKRWLAEGRDVRIVTARVAPTEEEIEIGVVKALKAKALEYIHAWCLTHIGELLPVTCSKDFGMVELWDDRVVQVVPNEGERVVRRMFTQAAAQIIALRKYAEHKDSCASRTHHHYESGCSSRDEQPCACGWKPGDGEKLYATGPCDCGLAALLPEKGCPDCADSLAAMERIAAETGNTYVGDFGCPKHRRKPAWDEEEKPDGA